MRKLGSTQKAHRRLLAEDEEEVQTSSINSTTKPKAVRCQKRVRRKTVMKLIITFGRNYLLLSIFLSLIALCHGQDRVETSVSNSKSSSSRQVTITTSYSSTNVGPLSKYSVKDNNSLSGNAASPTVSLLDTPVANSDVSILRNSRVFSANGPHIVSATSVGNTRRPKHRTGPKFNTVSNTHPANSSNPSPNMLEKRIFSLPALIDTLQSAWKPMPSDPPVKGIRRDDESASTTAKPTTTKKPRRRTTKPTMSPLRVLQTEINHVVKKPKTSKETKESIETQTSRSMTLPGGDKNLGNHRVESSTLAQDVQDQLNLINQRFASNQTFDTSTPRSGGGPTVKKSKKKKKKGNSASIVRPTPYVEESKQLKFDHPFNYMQGFTDNIAEEGHHHHATAMMMNPPPRYDKYGMDQPNNYQVYPTMMGPGFDQIPPTAAGSLENTSGATSEVTEEDDQRYKDNVKGGSISKYNQGPSDNNVNSGKPEQLTGPSAGSSQLETSGSSNNYRTDFGNDAQTNEYKAQYYSEQPYENYDNGNNNRPLSGPGGNDQHFGGHPNQNQYGHSGPGHQHQQPQLSAPAGTYADFVRNQPLHEQNFYSQHQSASASNSLLYPGGPAYDPRPPIRDDAIQHDEGHFQQPDSIMDRFEVFYAEHKILTWGAFLILGGLALATIVVFMWINNPPTEVVTAKSIADHYLMKDPGIQRFLKSLLLDVFEPPKKNNRHRSNGNRTASVTSVRSKSLKQKSTSTPALHLHKTKAL